MARRQRGALLAARPVQRDPQGQRKAVPHRTGGRRFGRRPLDRARVDRARRAGAGDHACAHEPLFQPGRLGLRPQAARHDARALRRARGAEKSVSVLVMGVSGSGKTTIGRALALKLGWPYRDADDYHPAANVAKMAAGTPLNDADRQPWLDKLNSILREEKPAILGCSALKEAYRQRLTAGLKAFRIVYLHGSFELLSKRAAERQHRFMPASLLKSQFETLEPPHGAIEIASSEPVEECVAAIRSQLDR